MPENLIQELAEARLKAELLAQECGRLKLLNKGIPTNSPKRDKQYEAQSDYDEALEHIKTIHTKMDHSPLSKVSIGNILDHMVEVEACFKVRGSDEAWAKLTAFIDWLEKEEWRLEHVS